MRRIPELKMNASTDNGLILQLDEHYQEKYPNTEPVIDITDDTAFVEITTGNKQKRYEHKIETVKSRLQPFMST